MASVRERTIPTEGPPLVGEVSANFWRIEECRVVSAADPYGRNLSFVQRKAQIVTYTKTAASQILEKIKLI
jgi:hypothetical protein